VEQTVAVREQSDDSLAPVDPVQTVPLSVLQANVSVMQVTPQASKPGEQPQNPTQASKKPGEQPQWPQKVRTPSPPDKPGSARCYVHMRRYDDPADPEKLKGKLPPSIHVCYKGPREFGRKLSAGNPEEGSHGAWTLSSTSCYHFDYKFALHLSQVARGKTLTELGAGKGCYSAFLKANGVDVVAAVDGASNIGSLTKGVVATWDLTKPMEATADWVMSLEVAEHIPPEFEDSFLDNVVRNARCYVILSWSKMALVGSGHVNPRNRTYVWNKMKSLGFIMADKISGWLHRRAAWMYYAHVYYRHADCPEPLEPGLAHGAGKAAPTRGGRLLRFA